MEQPGGHFHIEEIVEHGGVNTAWLAEGIQSHEAEDFTECYGLNLVTNFCIMEQIRDLGI
jgi:predicted CoA-binding protein